MRAMRNNNDALVTWVHVDSLAGLDALLVSMHWAGYMRCTDAELSDLAYFFSNEHAFGVSVLERVQAEQTRRAALESGQ